MFYFLFFFLSPTKTCRSLDQVFPNFAERSTVKRVYKTGQKLGSYPQNLADILFHILNITHF